MQGNVKRTLGPEKERWTVPGKGGGSLSEGSTLVPGGKSPTPGGRFGQFASQGKFVSGTTTQTLT